MRVNGVWPLNFESIMVREEEERGMNEWSGAVNRDGVAVKIS